MLAISFKKYWFTHFEEDETKNYKVMKAFEQLAAEYTWIQCNKCLKWRKLAADIVNVNELPSSWYCKGILQYMYH